MDQGRIVEDRLKEDFFGSAAQAGLSARAREFLSKILSH